MSPRILAILATLTLVTACGDGQPFFEDGTGTDDDSADREFLPGTEDPSPNSGLFRYEDQTGNGGGYLSDYAYDADDDTFTVDGIAFDGDNTYVRSTIVPTLASDGAGTEMAVYEATETTTDQETGTVIDNFDYRAVYGQSRNTVRSGGEDVPRSEFAIVRTEDYLGYGFGGFLYQRAGGVEIPVTGDAVYAGEYAGMRVFDGRGGLEFTRGDASIQIDFKDFNEGVGIRGRITNREVFDINGNPVALGTDPGELNVPPLIFVVTPDASDANGEITAEVRSQVSNGNGGAEIYEEGTYYAVMSGEADEIVGVIVVESEDPRFTGVTAQETGGFIVYRE